MNYYVSIVCFPFCFRGFQHGFNCCRGVGLHVQAFRVSNKLSLLCSDTVLTSHLSGEEFGVVPPHESHVSGEQWGRRRAERDALPSGEAGRHRHPGSSAVCTAGRAQRAGRVALYHLKLNKFFKFNATVNWNRQMRKIWIAKLVWPKNSSRADGVFFLYLNAPVV